MTLCSDPSRAKGKDSGLTFSTKSSYAFDIAYLRG